MYAYNEKIKPPAAFFGVVKSGLIPVKVVPFKGSACDIEDRSEKSYPGRNPAVVQYLDPKNVGFF